MSKLDGTDEQAGRRLIPTKKKDISKAEEFFHQYKLGDVEPPPRWAMRFADAYAKHYALKMLREDTDKMISKDLKESGVDTDDIIGSSYKLGILYYRDELIKRIEG